MTGEEYTKKQLRGLSIFERYLTIWVALCIVGGIVLGGPGGFHPDSGVPVLYDVSDYGQD
jgi:hypothetical protein